MIFDIPVSDSDKPFLTKFPKKLFSYIKTQKTENSSIPPLRKNGLRKSDTHIKSNILNQQFHKAFTPVTDSQITDKGFYSQMKDSNVQVSDAEKLLGNIKPQKAKGPDEINGSGIEFLNHSALRLVADDSIIYKQIHSINDARELQEDLETAARWVQDWLMCFHPDKCNVLSATQKQKPVQFIYRLHGHSLEKTDSTKHLGVTLQSNLKWDKYFNNITSKANRTLGFLHINLGVNSKKIKDHAYKALVRLKLNTPHVSGTLHNPTKQIKLRKFSDVPLGSLVIAIIIQVLLQKRWKT